MIIELFSGIGHSLGEEAIRIDFDPKTKPTIIADVRYLPLRPGLKPEHIHGSPPCRYFSDTTFLPNVNDGIDYEGLAQSFELVGAFFRAIKWLEPVRWTMETPGKGILARLLRESKVRYRTGELKSKLTSFYQSRRSLNNSIIPKEVIERYLD